MLENSNDRVDQRSNRSGFTLIELGIVLMILAALAMVAMHLVDSNIEHAEEAATRATMEAIRGAILGNGTMGGYYDDMADRPMLINANADDGQLSLSVSRVPRTVCDLLLNPDGNGVNEFNPSTQLGWRKNGYLRDLGAKYVVRDGLGFKARYGSAGLPTINDSFRNINLERSGMPIIIQWPIVGGYYEPQYARLVSAGPDNIIQTPFEDDDPDSAKFPLKKDCGDDIVVYLFVADERQ